MKRLKHTNADWIANVLDAEDRAIRKRARLAPLPVGSACDRRFIVAYKAAVALYTGRRERSRYVEDR